MFRVAPFLRNRLAPSTSSSAMTVVGSPFHGNEDNGLLRRLQEVVGGDEAIFRSPRAEGEVTLPGFPRLARRRDLAANVRGLERLGFRRVGGDDGTGGVERRGGAVVVLGDALADVPEGALSDASLVVYLGAVEAPAARDAHFVLPVTSFAEQEGTFTNFEGRVQRYWPALWSARKPAASWSMGASGGGCLTTRAN